MANTIKLKRGSGSDPGASDLVVGEVAVRTDTGKLFTKKDDNSIAEISGGIDDGDKGDITVSSSGATFTIDSGVVTSAKIADGTIVNADINSSAAIAGSKISPTFTSDVTIDATGYAGLNFETDRTTATSNIGGPLFKNASGTVVSKIQSLVNGTINIIGGSGSEKMIVAIPDGAAELYNNGSKKFETSSSGGTITGTLVADAFTGPLTGNVTGNASGSSGSCTGNAATATKLAATKTIAGVAFDGSANISLNNNAITNGAGYITATLTNEQVEDIVGGMLTGNTETGITVTYQDGDGTIDFVVGTLNQDTTGNAATATALETARNIGGVSFNGTANINLPGVNTTGNQNTSGTSGGFTAGSASNLNSGTLPDARFPSTLPAISGANLTNLPASGGPTGGGSDKIFTENAQAVTTNYTIGDTFGAACNAMAAGPITINSGVTVTVNSGETLTIV